VRARLSLILALCLPLWLAATPAGSVEIGQAAPAIDLPLFSTQEESATTMSLVELRGKVVYLDFWASWCSPCRMSFPKLEQLRLEFAPQGFEVLAVNVDEFEADAVKFLEEIPVSYPVVHDAAGLSPQAYGILGMPTGYLIDRKGVIRLVHQGFRRNDGAKLKLKIVELLGE